MPREGAGEMGGGREGAGEMGGGREGAGDGRRRGGCEDKLTAAELKTSKD